LGLGQGWQIAGFGHSRTRQRSRGASISHGQRQALGFVEAPQCPDQIARQRRVAGTDSATRLYYGRRGKPASVARDEKGAFTPEGEEHFADSAVEQRLYARPRDIEVCFDVVDRRADEIAEFLGVGLDQVQVL